MEQSRVNLNHLITFYLVSREQSFSVAAEKLCLTEPAISRQISSLERCCRAKLFDVRRKRVYLTQIGEVLIKYAEQIYEQSRDAQHYLESLQESGLHVGVCRTLSSIVALAASEFEKLFPHAKLIIRDIASFQLTEGLLHLQHDIIIVVSMNYGSDRLKATRVADGLRLVLVASPSVAASFKGQLKLVDLCGYPMLLPREGSGTRNILLSRFEAEGLNPEDCVFESVEVDSFEFSKGLAEAGRGIALLPEFAVKDEVAQGKMIILPLADDITFSVDVLVHKGIPLSALAEHLIYFVNQAFQGLTGVPPFSVPPTMRDFPLSPLVV